MTHRSIFCIFAFGQQITAEYAAYFALPAPDEARVELRACLPAHYDTPWRKRIPPFFSTIASDRPRIENRVLPCHVASSLYYSSRALADC